MAETRLIDDLIILGRACPERIKDGRITVCLGGYSPSLGFVRIYPTRTKTPWNQWDIVRVEVEQGDRDTRDESWKIAGSRTEWENLSNKIKVVDKLPRTEWRNLVANLVDGCVQDINDSHHSLGIVKPNILKHYFKDNPLYDQMFQEILPGFGEPTKVKHDYPFEPRVTYRCSDCKTERSHDQQVLEWGFYEWFRKHPDKIDQVWVNAKFGSPKHEIYFFVGNQFKYRNSFVVISILRVPRGPIQIPLVPLRKWKKEEI